MALMGACCTSGITLNPTARLREHRAHKSWWAQVASIKMEHFDSRAQAADAELRTIATENPLYNIIGRDLRETLPLALRIDEVISSIEEASATVDDSVPMPVILQDLSDARATIEQATQILQQSVLAAYANSAVSMTDIEEASGYTRQHITRIARASGLPARARGPRPGDLKVA